MSQFWEKVLESKKIIEKNKQINIKNYRNGDVSFESLLVNDLINEEDPNFRSMELMSDVLKENPGELNDNIDAPKGVQEGTPQDPSKATPGAGIDDGGALGAGGTEMDAANADAGSSAGAGGEEEEEEEIPQYRLNKNEFATENGMKFLSSRFNDLLFSIDKSIKEFQKLPDGEKTLIELRELSEKAQMVAKTIPVNNIWDTQTKYNLYIELYKRIIKRAGVKLELKK